MALSTVHIIWGELAANLYRRRVIDNSVRLAHAVYDFKSDQESHAFLFGIREARKPSEWAHVTHLPDQRSLGMPLRSRLIDAIIRGDADTVELMLDAGVSPETKSPDGMSAFQLAARHGQDVIAETLLERGAKPEEPADSLNTHSALHLAASCTKPGATRIVDMISERDVQLDRPDRDGRTALMRAIDESRLDAARILLEKGAKPGIGDDGGVSAKDRFDKKFGGVVQDPAVDKLSAAFESAEAKEAERLQKVGAATRHASIHPSPMKPFGVPSPYGRG